jgi:hypothetical protein
VKLNVWRQFHRLPGLSHKAVRQTSNFRHSHPAVFRL